MLFRSQIRTDRTTPFERADFTNLSTGAFGTRGGIRTRTLIRREILSLLCLPFHHSRISFLIIYKLLVNVNNEKHFKWCPRGDSNSQNLVSKTNMATNYITGAINIFMSEFKTAEPELWKHAKKFPYIERKFSTNVREFTPDYQTQKIEFVLTELKQIWCRKAESNR